MREISDPAPPWLASALSDRVSILSRQAAERSAWHNTPGVVRLFTDGSKLACLSGYSVVGLDDRDCHLFPPVKHRLMDSTSVHEADLYRFLAVSLVERQKWARSNIYCDSQAILKSLTSAKTVGQNPVVFDRQKKTLELIMPGCDICSCWVSRHCGVPGNEVADRAAKRALGRDHHDAANVLCSADIRAVVLERVMSSLRSECSNSLTGQHLRDLGRSLANDLDESAL